MNQKIHKEPIILKINVTLKLKLSDGSTQNPGGLRSTRIEIKYMAIQVGLQSGWRVDGFDPDQYWVLIKMLDKLKISKQPLCLAWLYVWAAEWNKRVKKSTYFTARRRLFSFSGCNSHVKETLWKNTQRHRYSLAGCIRKKQAKFRYEKFQSLFKSYMA